MLVAHLAFVGLLFCKSQLQILRASGGYDRTALDFTASERLALCGLQQHLHLQGSRRKSVALLQA